MAGVISVGSSVRALVNDPCPLPLKLHEAHRASLGYERPGELGLGAWKAGNGWKGRGCGHGSSGDSASASLLGGSE